MTFIVMDNYTRIHFAWRISFIARLSMLVLCGTVFAISPVLALEPHEGEQEECRSILGPVNRTDYTTINLDRTTQRLRGKIILEQGIKVAQFLSVPYANKPKRFQAPEPMPPWSGVRDALHWPAHCTQNNLHQYEYLTRILNYSVSEDCLFLNIWSAHPDLVRLPNRTNVVRSERRFPVVIFIHGGGFNYMGISTDWHYGGVVAALGKVVFVAMNYRVGLFGFLNSQLEHHSVSHYPQNVGLYDQVAAIEWVKKYIHIFGGDPNRITLQGQSAGAISVGLLMLSPRSSGLFQRAILQSASPMMMKQMFSGSHYSRLMQLSNCSRDLAEHENATSEVNGTFVDYEYFSSTTEQIHEKLHEMHCLEMLPEQTLNKLQGEMFAESSLAFGPTIPSVLLPDFASELLSPTWHGHISPKEMLIGANTRESTLYLHQEFPKHFPLTPNITITQGELVHTLHRLLGNSSTTNNLANVILDTFAHDNSSTQTETFFSFLSDFIFKGPVFKFAQSWANFTQSATYLYQFEETLARYPEWIGAAHSLEMDFVSGMPLLYPERFSPQQRDLSIRMIQTWAHFASTGQMLPQLGVEWPLFEPQSKRHLRLQSRAASTGVNLDMLYYPYFDLLYDAS